MVRAEARPVCTCRCGPFDMALKLLCERGELRSLVKGMVTEVLPIGKGVEAMELAQRKGTLKVQLRF